MVVVGSRVSPAPLDVALAKLAAGERLTLEEGLLVQRRLVELTSPDASPARAEPLGRATERLRAMGIDDDVVFSGTADEAIAYLDATEPRPCASST